MPFKIAGIMAISCLINYLTIQGGNTNLPICAVDGEDQLSHVMRKPVSAICEQKGADQPLLFAA